MLSNLNQSCRGLVAVGIFCSASASAQSPGFCQQILDIQEEAIQYSRQSPLNTAPTQKLSPKAMRADQDARAEMLLCSSQALPNELDVAIAKYESIGGFKLAVLKALRANALSKDAALKAIYLNSLGDYSYQTAEARLWQAEAASEWCRVNGRDHPDPVYGAQIPANLPTIEDGVRSLSPRAIYLGYQIISRRPSSQLGLGCRTSARNFFQ